MPRRKKDKLPGIHSMHNADRSARKRRDSEGSRDEIFFSDDDGSVIKNWFATGDDVDPFESLRSIQEMFKGKLDPDVVSMVFSECEFNVDQALESLFALASENIPEELQQNNESSSLANQQEFSVSEPVCEDNLQYRDVNTVALDEKRNENKNLGNSEAQADISLAEVHHSENDTLVKGAACKTCDKHSLEFSTCKIIKAENGVNILGSRTSLRSPLSNDLSSEELQLHDSNDQNLTNANNLSRYNIQHLVDQCNIQNPIDQCKSQFMRQFAVPSSDCWMMNNIHQNAHAERPDSIDNNCQHVNMQQLHKENKFQCENNADSKEIPPTFQQKIFSPSYLNKLTSPPPYLPLNNNQRMQSEIPFFQTDSTPQFITPIVPTSMLRKSITNTNISFGHASNKSFCEPIYSTAVTHPECNKQSEGKVKTYERSNSVDMIKELEYDLLEPSLKLFQPKEHVACLIKQGCKVLVIMRGLPGSGKSTLAEELQYSGVILSTDDYFHKGGKYKYDLAKLSDAHEWNKRRAKKAMSKGKTPVIIDNTNVESWEIKPYVAMGLKYGYNIEILEPDTKWKFSPSQLAKKNIHNVSQGKIEHMLERYEHNVTVHKIIQSLSEHSLKESSPSKITPEISSVHKSPEIETLPQQCKINEILVEPIQSETDKNIESSPEKKSSTVLLEAVVHQEDEQKNEKLDETVSPQHGAAHLISYSDDQDNEVFDFNDIDNKKMDLQDLMALLQQDSEESLSHSRHTSTSCSSQDMSGWEAITEHDDDFLWSESSAGRRGSTTLNTKILEEDEDSNSEDEKLDNIERPGCSLFNYSPKDITVSAHATDLNCASAINKSIPSDSLENVCINKNTDEAVLKDIPEPLCAWKVHPQNCPEDSWECSESNNSKHIEQDFHEILDPKPQRAQASYIVKNQFASSIVETNHVSNLFAPNDSVYETSEEDKEVNVMWSDTESDTSMLDWDNSNQIENIKQANFDVSDEPKPQRQQILNKKEKETLSFTFRKFSPVLSSRDSDHQKSHQTIKKDKEMPSFQKALRPCRRKIAACFDIKENSNCLQKDWQFPTFPCENNSQEVISELPPQIEYMESETQTELSEFFLLHRIQVNQPVSNNVCILPARTDLKIKKETASCNTVNVTKKFKTVQFDKSTTTDDIPEEIGITEKLKFLQTCFPALSSDDLKDIYEKCHGDHLWAANILLDFEQVYNVGQQQTNKGSCDIQTLSLENESSSNMELVDVKNSKSVVETDVLCQGVANIKYSSINVEELQSNITNPEDIQNASSISSSDAKSFESYENDSSTHSSSTHKSVLSSCEHSENSKFPALKFRMVLDPTFAKQLEEHFGPVGFAISPEALNADDLTITVNLDLARMIHESWSESLKMKFEKEEEEMRKIIQLGSSNSDTTANATESEAAYLKSLLDDPVVKKMLPQVSYESQSLAGDKKSSRINIKLKEKDKVMPLSEIMSMEAALELSRKEMEKECNMDLSTRMKLQRVYDMFPGIDRIAINDVFDANNYSLPKTIACIEQATGSPGIPLNTKEREELEQEFLEVAKQESLQFNHEWQDWITFDDEPVVPSPNAISCDDLRAEAAVHYQLRYECFQKSQEAHSRGLYAVASFYSQQGSIHTQKVQEANRRASERILEIRNASTDPMILDLHGLYVKEALHAIKNFLADKKIEFRNSSSHNWVLSIITGRGSHSMLGVPRLRPAVTEYLKRGGYSFEESSEGVFKISLT